MKVKCLACEVYYNNTYRTCSNKGISLYNEELYYESPNGYIELEDSDERLIRFKQGAFGSIVAEPINIPNSKKLAGPMFGGCFVYSSDSRFSRAIERQTGLEAPYAAIPLHDRFETWEQYDMLSR